MEDVIQVAIPHIVAQVTLSRSATGVATAGGSLRDQVALTDRFEAAAEWGGLEGRARI